MPSNVLFSPINDATILLICFVSNNCPTQSKARTIHQYQYQNIYRGNCTSCILFSCFSSYFYRNEGGVPSPTPGIPALFDTTVKSLRSGRSRSAFISEFGTPEKPKPPTSKTEFPCMSLMASCAEGHILFMERFGTEDENWRVKRGIAKIDPDVVAARRDRIL